MVLETLHQLIGEDGKALARHSEDRMFESRLRQILIVKQVRVPALHYLMLSKNSGRKTETARHDNKVASLTILPLGKDVNGDVSIRVTHSRVGHKTTSYIDK